LATASCASRRVKNSFISAGRAANLSPAAHVAPRRLNRQTAPTMPQVIQSLSFFHVFVVAAVGFLFGWLWYSPLMFNKAWVIEMQNSSQAPANLKGRMGQATAVAFLFTLLSTFGLAVLINEHHTATALRGAEFGAFVGAIVVGSRMLNSSVWENRSPRLLRINIGHEIVLFALQGALLGCCR
jgi:hypothetical protein